MRCAPWIDRLAAHAGRVVDRSLPQLIAEDASRVERMILRVGPIHANFARQRMDAAAWQALIQMAHAAALPAAFRALVDGATVNATEQRAALHTALRSDVGRGPVAEAARAQALEVQPQADRLAAQLVASDVTDVINVGIGGSDLGPRFVVDALREHSDGRFRVHFLSNVDAHAAQCLLRQLDPRRTAVVLVSKTFSTQETLINGDILRAWLNDDSRLFAVSANVERAMAFGLPREQILPMWDWVGGRYSLWSAVGFSARLALGADGFAKLLEGAASMDHHALDAPIEANLPIWHALTAVWNRNALGLATQAILPYDDRLARLPAFLQQLVMESLGKCVHVDGTAVDGATVPVVWGAPGTDSQHSFFQALHQGTDSVPADFIGVVNPDHAYSLSHAALLANLLAQSEAFANGAEHADPHRRYPGSRPNTLILLDALTPHSLGALLAMYEHSVYAQAVLWGINAFDQWGVELGKKIAGDLLPALTGSADVADPITRQILAEIRLTTRRDP
ncbi:MAG: glucose-6-phosphate isomerase [Pseudomarimonas sp.]